MSRYCAQMNDTLTAATSIGSVHCHATTMRRMRIDHFIIGMEATPADGAMLITLARMTALGTATAVTVAPIDPADQAAINLSAENYTAEPTITANTVQMAVPMHQRSTFQWYAPPGGELVIPATASNGIVWTTTTVNGASGAITVTGYFTE